MIHENNQPDDASNDFKRLEDLLRAMPQAAPPVELLERLRADIPDAQAFAASRHPRRRTSRLRWIAAAALLLLGLTVVVTRRDDSASNEVSPQNILRHTYACQPQETDPCSVLPPFPLPSRS